MKKRMGMKERTIVTMNILLQVAWLALAGVITYYISNELFSGLGGFPRAVLGGVTFVVVVVLLTIITNIFKATKDPDVQAAADLRMDVRRYKQYREWYDEHERLMREYGFNSSQAEKYFTSFFKKIDNPNEWRRYQQYRYDKSREERRNSTFSN